MTLEERYWAARREGLQGSVSAKLTEAILSSANGHVHQAAIPLRAPTVCFGANGEAGEQNGSQS